MDDDDSDAGLRVASNHIHNKGIVRHFDGCLLYTSGNQARRVFYKHALAMMSVSADVIVKDYDENALVVTNLAGSACEGKAQIHAFCDHLMHSYGKILKSLRLHGLSAIHWKTTPAGGHLALFALDARCLGMVMTETYWVEDGKIRFESSICRGGMQETIQNL